MSSKRSIPIAELINLAQKRAIVTGGVTGIGFAISHRLAEAGATVIFDKDPDGAQEAARKIRGYGYGAGPGAVLVGFHPELDFLK